MNFDIFQFKVVEWLYSCFGHVIATDTQERSYRMLEESLEVVQACGLTKAEALMLVDYTYSRPIGVIGQEIGGLLVTLAALANAQGYSMGSCATTELDRCWANKETIRVKQLNKPVRSPLPMHVVTEPTARTVLIELLRLYDWRNELGKLESQMACEAHSQEAHEKMRKDLLTYGREKKAAWEAARRVLMAHAFDVAGTVVSQMVITKEQWPFEGVVCDCDPLTPTCKLGRTRIPTTTGHSYCVRPDSTIVTVPAKTTGGNT